MDQVRQRLAMPSDRAGLQCLLELAEQARITVFDFANQQPLLLGVGNLKALANPKACLLLELRNCCKTLLVTFGKLLSKADTATRGW